MFEGLRQRLEDCPSCGMQAAGDGKRCIFCGGSLMLETVEHWRGVYHPYSYADAMLATATLQAHGCTTRFKYCGVARMLTGQVGGVVEVARGEHLHAQEILRQLRGVRTDTEYLEWQEFKERPARRRRLMFGVVAAAAAVAAAMAWGLIVDDKASAQTPREQVRR